MSSRSILVQVNNAKGEPWTKVLSGETAGQAKQRIGLEGICLENSTGLALCDDDLITVDGQPYVFKTFQQQHSVEEYQPVLEFAKKQMDAQTEDKKSMSKAGYTFARQLLNGMGIRIRTDSVNCEEGSSANPIPYDWTVETKHNQSARPAKQYKTPGALNWFVENFLPPNEMLGVKVVTGHPLPALKGNKKKSRGKGDVVIGKKLELEVTEDAYDFAFGLIELRQDIYPINKGQNVLELASVCTISRVERNCALLATDCNSQWELYWFEDTKTIVRRVYQHGRKCWEDFKALLDVAEMKTLKPPSKIPPVLPNYEEALDDEAAEVLDEQNLDGFEIGDSKLAAVDRHAQLNELANWLGDLYGERPVIPKWATAERKCPNYYD